MTVSRCDLSSVNCGRKVNGDISAGYIVTIQHDNGEVTRYLHMTNPATVLQGTHVTAGQQIGLSDSTGGVAAHLHFEIRRNGVAVDPDLFYNGQANVTLAMAVDEQIEFGTAQQIPVARGIITPDQMAQYVNIVELTDVEPGQHQLQFVLVQPRGQLRILAQVPLTVVPPGDFTGNEVSLTDILWTPSDTDLVEHTYRRFTSTFSLTAIDDQTAEGTAHLTFQTKAETNYSSTTDCPEVTFDSGIVEWDTPVTGFFYAQPDGTLYLAIDDKTPPTVPDHLHGTGLHAPRRPSAAISGSA